jgi:hypothetical protein
VERFRNGSRRRLPWVCVYLFLVICSGHAQSDPEINLKGVFDVHVHQAPDSMPRVIDADDLARLAKERGMRGMVMKNHFEDTASLVYLVRKEVPGIELIGGIAQNLAVGGINLEAVKHMAAIKGGYGRIVWLPTFDSENAAKVAGRGGPYVSVSKDGKLLPSVIEEIDWIAKNPQIVLETGHISAEEVIMVSHEAHQRGVAHVLVTHAMANPIRMTIPQMQEVVKDGTYLEFVYGATQEANPVVSVADYAKAIRAVGAKWCVLGSDYGTVTKSPAPQRSLEPDGMLEFMQALRKEGISVEDIDLMAKVNPLLALGLKD